MTTPIVIIHYTYAEYVEHAVLQAFRVSGGSPVILVSDFELRGEAKDLARHIPLSNFNDTYQSIARRYLHIGGTGAQGELFNLARWFILRDLSAYVDYQDVIYQDSDVLLTYSTEALRQRAKGKDLTLCNGASPNVTWFRDRSVIEDYCNLVMDFYNGKRLDILADVQEWIRKEVTTPGVRVNNICDMFFFQQLYERGTTTFEELTNVVNDSVHLGNVNPGCDPWLNHFESLGLDPDFPNLYWQAGVPYIKALPQYRDRYPNPIRVDSIHFQGAGGTKALMGTCRMAIERSLAEPENIFSSAVVR